MKKNKNLSIQKEDYANNKLADSSKGEKPLNIAYNTCRSMITNEYDQIIKTKEICHYTDLDGFVGIIANKSFWLTDSNYLNDSTEFTQGQDVIRTALEKEYKKYKNKSHASFLQSILEKIENWQNVTYVCSFSLSPDNLGQWKSYSDNARGICICFDTENILSSPSFFNFKPAYSLIKCIYLPSLKREIAEKSIRAYIKSAQQDYDNGNYDRIKYRLSLEGILLQLAISFKSSHFKNEKEVRIITLGNASEYFSERKYRIKNNRLIPYLCTNNSYILDENNYKLSNPEKFKMSRVIIGPIAEKELLAKGIRRFLDDKGYEDVPVILSKIPYRG